MSIRLPNKEVLIYGLVGPESAGKSTTGYQVTGRLRTHGHLARFAHTSIPEFPFPPFRLDESAYYWEEVILNAMLQETHTALLANVDLVVSEKTPFDLWLMARWKAERHFPDDADSLRALEALKPVCEAWMTRYDLIFVMPLEGTQRRADGCRESDDDPVDEYWAWAEPQILALPQCQEKIIMARGNYRERAEIVYHRLAQHAGEYRGRPIQYKPLRAMQCLREYLESRGIPITEIRLRGGQSLNRFHVPKDAGDDIDLEVYTPADAYEVHKVIEEARVAFLEMQAEADLDIAVYPDTLLTARSIG